VSRALAPHPGVPRRPAKLTAWSLLLFACPCLAASVARVPDTRSLEIGALAARGRAPSAAEVTAGTLDRQFTPLASQALRQAAGTRWVRLQSTRALPAAAVPVIVAEAGDELRLALYARSGSGPLAPLSRAAVLPEFGGTRQVAFLVPAPGLGTGQVFYARLHAEAAAPDRVYFAAGTLAATLSQGARHALMISLACGALLALALATAAMWLVLADGLFILYAAMTSLQALYLAYFSGEGFHWPLLPAGTALVPYAWNVPVALSGAAASLFAREIADLRHTSPRIHRAFGWLAAAFAALAAANAGRLVGLGTLIAGIGNLMFLGSAVFVLVIAFIAWRRGNRAAGWFLVAWVLLETFAMVTSATLLMSRAASHEALFYYGLPGSMVASAILTSLGVADRLREQRRALSEAERRARTDPLTGVLNRRSLIEELEAACRHARTNGLPLAVLFLDLDFFKSINDSHGHAAGDACLAAIIRPIQAELRQSDIIGRYGGEEFVVVLTGADVAAAEPIAERIRVRVAEQRVEGYGATIQLTCSIGVASSSPLGVWGEALIAQADVAAYAAKRLGRNRVQVAISLAA
jgi:diguanylate cyclase (GGDEF)-like protein